MMKHTFTLVTLAFGLAICSSSFGAVVLNGGFESGFTSWVTAGNTTVGGGNIISPPVSPPQLLSQALLTSGNGVVGQDNSLTVSGANGLESFLDLAAGNLNSIGAGAFRGSGIKQSLISVNAGDELTFMWNFLTTEARPSANNDFAFFSVSRDTSTGFVPTLTLLANTNSNFSPITGGDFAAQTGYQQASLTFALGGNYTLGFGVVNVPDQFGPSGLLLDQVSITAVPEPSSLSLIGLLALGLVARRQRSR